MPAKQADLVAGQRTDIEVIAVYLVATGESVATAKTLDAVIVGSQLQESLFLLFFGHSNVYSRSS